MKILQFTAENVRGLRAVRIDTGGNDVTLSGKNGSGKTSIIECIKDALASGGVEVRLGQERGEITIILGDDKPELTVKVVKTASGERLVLSSPGVKQYAEPRTMLKNLIGELTIDPLEFSALNGRDRLDLLFRLVPGLETALQDADKSVAAIKAKRSNILAQGQRVKVELEKMPPVIGAPAAPVVMSALADEYAQAVADNNARAERRKTKAAFIDTARLSGECANSYSKELADLEQKFIELREKIDMENAAQTQALADAERCGEIPDDTDLAPIKLKMTAAEAQQALYLAAQARTAKAADRDALAADYTVQGAALKSAEEARAQILAGATMPIPGLSVDGVDVVYNGTPMDSLCTKERLLVGTAIAVAQKPKAKIILVDNASLLDADSREAMHAAAPGFQFWEVVNDATGDKGFFIEDGEIRETNV